MGGEGFKNWLATISSSLSKVFLFIVLPLILVSGFASLLVQKGSNWPTSSSSSSNTSLNGLIKPSFQAKERDGPVYLHSEEDVVASVGNGSILKAAALAVGYSVSTPIVAQSPLQDQHFVSRPFSLFITVYKYFLSSFITL